MPFVLVCMSKLLRLFYLQAWRSRYDLHTQPLEQLCWPRAVRAASLHFSGRAAHRTLRHHLPDQSLSGAGWSASHPRAAGASAGWCWSLGRACCATCRWGHGFCREMMVQPPASPGQSQAPAHLQCLLPSLASACLASCPALLLTSLACWPPPHAERCRPAPTHNLQPARGCGGGRPHDQAMACGCVTPATLLIVCTVGATRTGHHSSLQASILDRLMCCRHGGAST